MLVFRLRARSVTMQTLGLLLLCLIILLNISTSSGLERDNDEAARVSSSISNNADIFPTHQNSSTVSDNLIHDASTLSVYIAKSGRNTPDCIHKGSAGPCQTIQHAYDQTMIQITNLTTSVKFVFMDDIYNMTDSFVINKEAKFVKIIMFTTMNTALRTNITSMKDDAMFWIGCNISNAVPCISYDVEFNNLNFKGFGSKFPAVLVVFNVKILSLNSCSFSQNNCSAINSLDTSLNLINIVFSENKGSANFKDAKIETIVGFPLSNISNGGALGLVFRDRHNEIVNISYCNFIGNKAANNLVLPYVEHKLGDTQFPRVGGGVLLLFIGNCSRVNVTFFSSVFIKNAAYAAGAVGIISESYSSANKVSFVNCTFAHNIVKYTAGAILSSSWDYSKRNLLVIADCKLYNNRAMYAGAVKYIIDTVQEMDEKGSIFPGLEIIRSHLCHNIAQTGSAIHIITSAFNHRQLSLVHIVDSVFCHHDFPGYSKSEQSVSQYGGTILTHRIGIKFIGHNSVRDNRVGCGLYASNANIHVNGTLNFKRNVAVATGGGMTLADTSHLILYPGSHLRFEENEAGTQGGALAVFSIGMPKIVYSYNPFCFLQYSIPNQPHSKWDTKVEFIGNSAVLKGGAIFINTMTACLWSEYPPHYSFQKAFRWNDNFVYKGNFIIGNTNGSVYDEDIATDTYKLVLHNPLEGRMSPGEAMPLNLSGYDELNSPAHSVAIAYSRAKLRNGSQIQSHLNLPNKYFILDPYQEKKLLPLVYEVDRRYYKGIANGSVKHEITFFDSYSSFIAEATFNLTPIHCRPGYVYDGKGACKCNLNGDHIKRCSGTKITLSSGLWATSSNGKLTAFQCPPNYCKCTQYTNPEDCVYNSLQNNSQCSRNRRGVLCGACQRRKNNVNYGLSLNSGECIECDSQSMEKARGGFVFLTAGVLLVSLLVVYLNPSFSTKMRGPAFFVQMLPYIYSDSSDIGDIIRFAAAVLTLGGSSHLPIPGCLGHDWSMLDIIALTYVFAVVILLVLLIIYILSRCFLLNFNRDSPFESFWILLIATYCFFSETSLIFFYCVDINGRRVFFYDGTVECFNGKHLIMVVISSIVLVLFVLLPPLAVTLISMGRTNAPLQVVDALTKGLRFQYRWWWACDLMRRFAYVAVFVFIVDNEIKKVMFIVLTNVFLTVHTFCQPYNDTFANASEAFLLFSMSIIATLYNTSCEGLASDAATTIIAITFIYLLVLFLYLLLRFIERRSHRKFGNLFRRFDNSNIPIPYRASTPGRVEDS